MKENKLQGFTLIEVLLVIAILAILATIAIVAINPGKQLGESHDAERRSELRAIIDALQQYAVDNNGQYPDTIPWGDGDCPSNGLDICVNGMACDGAVLDVIAEDQIYIPDIPVDPSTDPSGGITGYKILGTSAGRISVCASETYSGQPMIIVQ